MCIYTYCIYRHSLVLRGDLLGCQLERLDHLEQKAIYIYLLYLSIHLSVYVSIYIYTGTHWSCEETCSDASWKVLTILSERRSVYIYYICQYIYIYIYTERETHWSCEETCSDASWKVLTILSERRPIYIYYICPYIYLYMYRYIYIQALTGLARRPVPTLAERS